MNPQILVCGDRAELYVPYRADFVDEIKKSLPYRYYDRKRKCWIIRADDLKQARALIAKYFETDSAKDSILRLSELLEKKQRLLLELEDVSQQIARLQSELKAAGDD